TKTIAPTKPAPKAAHASVFHRAVPQRALAMGANQRSQAARRSVARRPPIPVTRTSLPGGAVVAVTNRWRHSRFAGQARASAGPTGPAARDRDGSISKVQG